MLKKTKGCLAAVLLGSVLKILVILLRTLFLLIAKLMVLLGLWVPFIYALFGLGLYIGFGFNPLESNTFESSAYLVGMIACCVIALMITVKNLVINPTKNVVSGFREPIWKKKDEEDAKGGKRTKQPPPPDAVGWSPKKWRMANGIESGETIAEDKPEKPKKQPKPPKKQAEVQAETPAPPTFAPATRFTAHSVEKPEVYYSKVQKDILVHEYSDRFEVYRQDGRGKYALDKIEYK